MHNAAFDLAVAEVHFGLPWPPSERIEDTMVLAFLDDPNRRGLDLKGLAEELLAIPPEEQEQLREWIAANTPGISQRSRNWASQIC